MMPNAPETIERLSAEKERLLVEIERLQSQINLLKFAISKLLEKLAKRS